MPEGIDTAADAFQAAIDPGQTMDETPARAPSPPRDTAGRFAAVAEKPEPFLEIRMLEGDPDTGDLSDGGDDPRLRERERGIADGRVDQRAEREVAENAKDVRRSAPDAGDDVGSTEGEQGEPESEVAVDEEAGEDVDEGTQFEITVDGEPQTVSLGELRDGYIRTATFHSRLNKVNEHRQAVEQENQRVSQLRDLYINGLQFLDEDIRGVTPQEPDWDKEYEANPLAARQRQKQFNEIYAKLHQIRANRAWAIQNRQEEQDRASAKYAVEQFTQFVQDHSKLIKDETTLQRVIGGMRKTALAEGFNETEVAGVYDRRMLNVLFKAWMYDQGMAVKPQAQAALPGPKGTSLAPGSARPLSGSAGGRQFDEAKRQLARTGRLEDAQAFFQRFIR